MSAGRTEFDLQKTALLTDLYQLNMIQAYLDRGMTEAAVFEFFVRKLPPQRGFLLAAGLAQAVAFLQDLKFGEPELDWLHRTGRFGRDMLDYLAKLSFDGDLHAMSEGTVFFPNEPILRVTAPLPVAQLVESRLINLLHFETLIASKAARMVLAAADKTLIDFGLRRAHGAEAALLAARASYLAGFAGTATTPADPLFGIPIFGTMAHSFVQAHDSEAEAFEAFARSRPDSLVLLVDTYDVATAVQTVVRLARQLGKEGVQVHGIRLDSGDMAAQAKAARQVLDGAGLPDVKIYASGGLDETNLRALTAEGVPIDGFGIGTSLTTSFDLAALDCAYKLQEYKGAPKRKLSRGKETWPGRKQVYRFYGSDGAMKGDILTLEMDLKSGEPLIFPVMRDGRLLEDLPSLDETRTHAAVQLSRLPESLRRLDDVEPYRVTPSRALRALAERADRERLTGSG